MSVTPPTGSITRGAEGAYRVTGQLVFATARDLLLASATVFQQDASLTVELSGVENADSAGLALLIEWYCTAQRANRPIRFVGAPAQLRALAKISELETVLPFD